MLVVGYKIHGEFDQINYLLISRGTTYSGLVQSVDVVPGQRYNFTAYIKLLNLPPNAMYQAVDLTFACLDSSGMTFNQRSKH